MKEKIRRYVEYELRNQDPDQRQELIDEVTENIYEKYQELASHYENEHKAFQETIATIGDFSGVDIEAEERFSIQPGVYDIGLIVATVLAVMGAVLMPLIGLTQAFLFTLASILIFSASAYYTYYQAQYEKNVTKNIQRFHIYLDKAFSNTKTAFIFWSITLSFVLARLFFEIYFSIHIGVWLSDPLSMTQIEIGEVIFFSILFYVLSLALIATLFILAYQKLIAYYQTISGKDHLEGQILGNLKKILKGSSDTGERVSKVASSRWYLSVRAFGIYFAVIFLLHHFGSYRLVISQDDYTSVFRSIPMIYIVVIRPLTYFIGIPMIAIYGWIIYLIVRMIIHKKPYLRHVVVAFVVYLVINIVLMGYVLHDLIGMDYIFESALNPFSIAFAGLLLSIPALLVRLLLGGKKIDESDG